MSWLDTLAHLTSNIGRGAEGLFTLGGTELARKFGGQGAKNVLNPLATGLGANYEAGAVGGMGMLGANAAGLTTPTMHSGLMGGTSASGLMPASTAPPMSTATQMLIAGRGLQGAGGLMGGMSQPQQQPPPPQQMSHLEMIYRMYPSLRPGARMGQNTNFGGM